MKTMTQGISVVMSVPTYIVDDDNTVHTSLELAMLHVAEEKFRKVIAKNAVDKGLGIIDWIMKDPSLAIATIRHYMSRCASIYSQCR